MGSASPGPIESNQTQKGGSAVVGESWLTNRALAPEPYDGGGFVVPGTRWTNEDLRDFHKEIKPAVLVGPQRTVYLAGTMQTDWRNPVRFRLKTAGAIVWVPADNPQQSAALYVPKDLEMACNADAVFAYVAPGHKARGTHAEMGAAFKSGKPIWLVWGDGPEVYQFSATMAYKVFTDMDAAVDSLVAFIRSGVL